MVGRRGVGAHWEHEAEKKMKDGNSIRFRSGKVERVETKKGDPSISSHLKGKKGWR